MVYFSLIQKFYYSGNYAVSGSGVFGGGTATHPTDSLTDKVDP